MRSSTVPELWFFDNRDDAYSFMRAKNRAIRNTPTHRCYVLTDGPEDDYAVIELSDAIEMDVPYEWAV